MFRVRWGSSGIIVASVLSLRCVTSGSPGYGWEAAGASPVSGGLAGNVDVNLAGNGGSGGEACPASHTAQRSAGTVLDLPVQLVLGDRPFVFGQENVIVGGASLVALDLRFYISDVRLLRAGDAGPVAVDVLTAGNAPAPYGVYFFNAEDPSSASLHVLAPPGSYTGLGFRLGVDATCNARDPSSSSPPLDATSQMTWPHTGYLFFRYEGRFNTQNAASAGSGGSSSNSGAGAGAPASGGASSSFAGESNSSTGGASPGGGTGASAGQSESDAPPTKVHMGGNLYEDLAPAITVPGAFAIPAAGRVQLTLQLVLDEVFKGAKTISDLSTFHGPPGDEVILGEQLRRALPSLHAFVLKP